jgi:hypothetical protein
MIKKLLILSTDPTIYKWRTLPAKIKQIKDTLNTTKNATWEVEVRYHAIKPKIVNGRIPHEVMNELTYPYFRQGYHHVGLHLSGTQWVNWGLQSTLRGARHRDDDFVGEFYFQANETTRRGRYNQFVQTALHELWHELCHTTGVKDDLHDWHSGNTDITKADWSRFDMKKWQPKYQEGVKKIGLLTQLLNKLKKLYE